MKSDSNQHLNYTSYNHCAHQKLMSEAEVFYFIHSQLIKNKTEINGILEVYILNKSESGLCNVTVPVCFLI